jgi:molecular chaperone GrpE
MTNKKDDKKLTGIEKDLELTKQALIQAEEELAKMTETAARAAADLQNFRRRSEEEKGGLALYANLQFLQGIFPVIDNFQRAFEHIPKDLTENEWVKGVYGIEKQFMTTLDSLGLQEIPCQVGDVFDPNLHEALMQGPGKKDTIIECFERGYQFKNQVVRPAKVQVGDGS